MKAASLWGFTAAFLELLCGAAKTRTVAADLRRSGFRFGRLVGGEPHGDLSWFFGTPASGGGDDVCRNELGFLRHGVFFVRRQTGQRAAVLTIALASASSVNSGASPPQISNSHSLERTSSGPTAMPVRNRRGRKASCYPTAHRPKSGNRRASTRSTRSTPISSASFCTNMAASRTLPRIMTCGEGAVRRLVATIHTLATATARRAAVSDDPASGRARRRARPRDRYR